MRSAVTRYTSRCSRVDSPAEATGETHAGEARACQFPGMDSATTASTSSSVFSAAFRSFRSTRQGLRETLARSRLARSAFLLIAGAILQRQIPITARERRSSLIATAAGFPGIRFLSFLLDSPATHAAASHSQANATDTAVSSRPASSSAAIIGHITRAAPLHHDNFRSSTTRSRLRRQILAELGVRSFGRHGISPLDKRTAFLYVCQISQEPCATAVSRRRFRVPMIFSRQKHPRSERPPRALSVDATTQPAPPHSRPPPSTRTPRSTPAASRSFFPTRSNPPGLHRRAAPYDIYHTRKWPPRPSPNRQCRAARPRIPLVTLLSIDHVAGRLIRRRARMRVK